MQSNNEFTLHSCAITNSVMTEISGIVFIQAIGDGVKSGWGWGGDRDGDFLGKSMTGIETGKLMMSKFIHRWWQVTYNQLRWSRLVNRCKLKRSRFNDHQVHACSRGLVYDVPAFIAWFRGTVLGTVLSQSNVKLRSC